MPASHQLLLLNSLRQRNAISLLFAAATATATALSGATRAVRLVLDEQVCCEAQPRHE
jgi:hypothetical protein